MKRGVKAGPPYCVAPAIPLVEVCTCMAKEEKRMTLGELQHIECNLNAGYRWGCEMKSLVDEVKFYLTQSKA